MVRMARGILVYIIILFILQISVSRAVPGGSMDRERKIGTAAFSLSLSLSFIDTVLVPLDLGFLCESGILGGSLKT